MKHIYLILLIFLNFNITYSQTEEYNITSSDVTYLNLDRDWETLIELNKYVSYVFIFR